jgi:hypothetical protein
MSAITEPTPRTGDRSMPPASMMDSLTRYQDKKDNLDEIPKIHIEATYLANPANDFREDQDADSTDPSSAEVELEDAQEETDGDEDEVEPAMGRARSQSSPANPGNAKAKDPIEIETYALPSGEQGDISSLLFSSEPSTFLPGLPTSIQPATDPLIPSSGSKAANTNLTTKCPPGFFPPSANLEQYISLADFKRNDRFPRKQRRKLISLQRLQESYSASSKLSPVKFKKGTSNLNRSAVE